MVPDPSHELTDLEQKLADATKRFERTPGALWLAATAIIESGTRLGEALPSELAGRHAELLVGARKARDDAGPRSSENDVSAITAWVDLAEKRAPLERAVKAALAEVQTHRAAHVELGTAPTSRKALERALGEREKDVTEREARLAEPLDELEKDELERLRARGDEPDESATADAELLRRSQAARARLTAAPGAWHSSAIFGVALLALFASPFIESDLAREILRGLVVAAIVVGFAARERGRRSRGKDLIEAHAMRRRDEERLPAAKEDLARLVTAARALGALDAFGASDDGRALEERESKLVTLAPWIRELVSGFTADEASRFA